MSIRTTACAVGVAAALVASPAAPAVADSGLGPSGIVFVSPGRVEIGVPFQLTFDLRDAALGVYDYGSLWCQGVTLVRPDDGSSFHIDYFENTGEFDFVSWEVMAVPGWSAELEDYWYCELENEAPAGYDDPWWGFSVSKPATSEPDPAPVELSDLTARPRTVRFGLSRRAAVRARVKDTSGTVLRRATFSRRAGTRYWTWNPGDGFPRGRYRIVLVATDKDGGRDVARTTTRIRR